MVNHKAYFTFTVLLITLAGFTTLLQAQDSAPPMSEPEIKVDAIPAKPLVAEGEKYEKPPFEPYVAQINGNQVNIRSGPAESYYPAGRFKTGQKVVVRKELHGWAMIEPVGQCFSYIAAKFVKLQSIAPPADTKSEQAHTPTVSDATTSDTDLVALVGQKALIGKVTGNHVRVRAGSVSVVPPTHANRTQALLKKGDQVRILGKRDDYYIITSQPNWHFWVSLDFVKRMEEVTVENIDKIRKSSGQTATVKTGQPTVLKENFDQEYKQYQEIKNLYKTELGKPLNKRNFAQIRENLNDLVKSARSISVKLSAQRFNRRILQAEKAQKILLDSLAEDKKLDITLAQIREKEKLLVATFPQPKTTSKALAVKGKLAPSSVFTANQKNPRFQVLDKNDKIIYYAISANPAIDLSKWIGKNVSMVGQTTYETFGKIRIIHVAKIIELPQKPPQG